MILLYKILLGILIFCLFVYGLSFHKGFIAWCDRTNIKLMNKQKEILKKVTKRRR